MSARFSIVPTVALEDDRISHACLRILCVLCTFTDKRGWCWPSLTTLAEKSRIARNDVILHLKKLEGFGYIQRHRRASNGRKLSNGYLVRFDFPPDSKRLEIGDRSDDPTYHRSDYPTYHRSDDPTYHRSDYPTPNDSLERPKGKGSTATQAQPYDDSAPSGRAKNGAERYAFEGAVIKLLGRDFKRWLDAYPDIDLRAELTALDDHYRTNLLPSEQKKWFSRCSQALANRQERASATKRASQSVERKWVGL
jgi:hypothetical protein